MNQNFPILSSPLWVGISITHKCNLSCVHCIYSAGKETENELTTAEIKDLLSQCAEMGVYTVEFLGGEPFCRNDLNELIDYACNLRLGVVLNTNATLITSAWLKQYAKKILLFKIGFDGSNEEEHNQFRQGENAYKKTTNIIQEIQSYGIDVCLITTLHKNNIGHLEQIVSKCSEILSKGVFTVTLLTPRGRASNLEDIVLTPAEVKQAMIILKELKKKYQRNDGSFLIKEELPESVTLNPEIVDFKNGVRVCTAAITQMGISADGWAYPCTTMIGFREDDHNVRKHHLKDIWLHSALFVNMRNRNQINGKCRDCKYLFKCGGGCRYAAWAITGDYSNPDPFCWYEYEQ